MSFEWRKKGGERKLEEEEEAAKLVPDRVQVQVFKPSLAVLLAGPKKHGE